MEKPEILKKIKNPADLKKLDYPEMEKLAGEIRSFMVETVAKTGGHLAPSLGVVELTLALAIIDYFPDNSMQFYIISG